MAALSRRPASVPRIVAQVSVINMLRHTILIIVDGHEIECTVANTQLAMHAGARKNIHNLVAIVLLQARHPLNHALAETLRPLWSRPRIRSKELLMMHSEYL